MLHYQLSYWERDTFLRDVEVAIIGSGIVGLSAAIYLKEQFPQKKVVVVERGPLPIGASTRNAGFACFGSLSELIDDLQHSSMDEVLQLVEQRYRGLQRLRERYSDQAIGYEALGGFEVFREADQERFEQCTDQMESLNTALSPITGTPTTYKNSDKSLSSCGFQGVQHLILNQAEGQLHTGKLMQTLLRKAQALGVFFLCGTEVTYFNDTGKGVEIGTAFGWEFTAQQALVATNGFARTLLPELEVEPARNQVLITRPIAGLPIRGCFHYDRGYVYFRNVGNRLLLGGGRNLDFAGEQTATFGHTDPIQAYLSQLLRDTILPQHNFEIDQWWSGIMGVGGQKKPIITRHGASTVVAVRLGGMGVALGTHAGEQAAKLLKEN